VLVYVLLIAIAAFFILPLIVVISASFKYSAEIFTDPGLLPSDPGLENYDALFARAEFLTWFRNSAVVSSVGTLLTLAITSLSAYAFARIDFPFKNLLFGLMIGTLVLPSIMFLVPQFKLIAEIGLYDTLPALVLPGLAGVFGVFFMRQFFESLPRELEEAAFIDGATRVQTFLYVALPLAKPALATLGIITFLGSWNDFLWPLLILKDRTLLTLPPGLRTLQGAYTSEYGQMMAGAVITSIPVLLLYIFLQRYVVESVQTTGLKG
jgi:multiple sugar transport system permease protein